MIKVRAIEYGLPLVRVANTGISSMINPVGKVVKKINLNNKGHIDVLMPDNIEETIYSRYGKYLFLMFIYIIGLFIVDNKKDYMLKL